MLVCVGTYNSAHSSSGSRARSTPWGTGKSLLHCHMFRYHSHRGTGRRGLQVRWGSVWCDGEAWCDGCVWCDGGVWCDGEAWCDGCVWCDGGGLG